MFDVKEFKSHFAKGSNTDMIDYAIKNKIFFKEDIINAGIKSRLKRGKFANPSRIKKTLSYFIKIGFIIDGENKVKVNDKFIPKSQM